MAHRVSARPKREVEEAKVWQGEFVDKLNKRSEVTPDFHELKWYPKLVFFATGSERKFGANHYCLRDAEYLGIGHTVTPHFKMDLLHNTYPIIRKMDDTDMERHHIRGELYHVSVEHIHMLDMAFGNTFKSIRGKYKVHLEDQEPDEAKWFRNAPFTDALMYTAVNDYFKNMNVESYKTCRFSSADKKLQNKTFYDWDTTAQRASAFRCIPGEERMVGWPRGKDHNDKSLTEIMHEEWDIDNPQHRVDQAMRQPDEERFSHGVGHPWRGPADT